MQQNPEYSPCLTCTSVRDPGNCENKNCIRWRKWFVSKWEALRSDPRLRMECSTPQLDSVRIGGVPYVLPHRAQEYLQRNPCGECPCPKTMCGAPCPARRAWNNARNEVTQ